MISLQSSRGTEEQPVCYVLTTLDSLLELINIKMYEEKEETGGEEVERGG